MVHGEYNYHNILFDATSEKDNYGHRKLNVYTVNFDHFKKNVQVEDLYYFLRKAMEKQGFKEWISDGILNAYSAIIPLGKNELEYLKNRLMYPEKFWLNHKFCGISDSSRSSVGSYRIASERNIRHQDIRIPVCEES